ncbi:MAG TPA: 2-succinyl-5-enolpyruvyl-6-hydroxy-3-cyclohexene-1-carboxylic-acid synthase, partial [Solirubrobacteraceae bacterium]|nr:2-succinyl-5-enolpyruvyl-6-hydroxy-3-cyclohexene-1-carboxylic-acid synthase [Solirubrobacteraceae bacterium]
SGTAAAELAPAVIEAHQAGVPLIVLTADRPPELREVGAGQTIDQLKLYGDAAKWFFEVGVHDAGPERMAWVRSLACRAYWTAAAGRPGPVHLNFPLREPLIPPADLELPGGGRPGGRPWVAAPGPSPAAESDQLSEALAGSRRPVIVAGRYEREPLAGRALGSFAARARIPLLADPLSGARRGSAAIAHYDALLREPGFASQQAPDLVVRVGDLPTSKPLRGWLAELNGARQIAVGPEHAWQDPAGVVELSLAADPMLAFSALPALDTEDGWLESWRTADSWAAATIVEELGDELSEPAVAELLGRRLPAQTALVVASSMPVRDVESFWEVRDDPPRVLSNRGANGIDGTVSTAFGVAATHEGRVVLLTGDVALAYDIGGLLSGRRLGLALTIVLVNNGGGGIFDFLPVSGLRDIYEHHVATPTGLEFQQAAALYGLEYARAGSRDELTAALNSGLGAPVSTLIEVPGDRAANLALHQRINAAVARALQREVVEG